MCVHLWSLSQLQLFATSCTVACQTPLSMGSSRQEYWSGLPCPPPGDLPDPGIEPVSPALAGGFFTTKPCGKWFEPKSPLNSSYLSMVFPVVMYGCESWTVKKAERQRIDAFELWCWRRLLRVPWTARRSNQCILKEISPGCSLEGLMLRLKLQYLATSCEELTHWKRLWCWEKLGAGGEGDDRGWDGWMASPTQWTWVWVNSRSWWWTGRPGVLWFMGSQRVGHDWATELNWTELMYLQV